MTKQNYTALGELTSELKGKYKVLLFPCNQFLSQEPGTPDKASVKRMSTGKLDDLDSSEHVELMEKVEVNGENAHPVFEFLRYNSSLYSESSEYSGPISWNFAKFLVDSKGGVFKYYSPSTEISSIRPDLETVLANPDSPSSKRPPSMVAS